MEGEVDAQRKRSAVVAEQIDGGAYVLAPLAAERAAAGAVEAVCFTAGQLLVIPLMGRGGWDRAYLPAIWNSAT